MRLLYGELLGPAVVGISSRLPSSLASAFSSYMMPEMLRAYYVFHLEELEGALSDG
jgi:hypothetical protein